jgi:hypothetical protein
MHLKKQVAKTFIKKFPDYKKVKLEKKTCNLFYEPWLHIKTGYEMKELFMN